MFCEYSRNSLVSHATTIYAIRAATRHIARPLIETAFSFILSVFFFGRSRARAALLITNVEMYNMVLLAAVCGSCGCIYFNAWKKGFFHHPIPMANIFISFVAMFQFGECERATVSSTCAFFVSDCLPALAFRFPFVSLLCFRIALL